MYKYFDSPLVKEATSLLWHSQIMYLAHNIMQWRNQSKAWEGTGPTKYSWCPAKHAQQAIILIQL